MREDGREIVFAGLGTIAADLDDLADETSSRCPCPLYLAKTYEYDFWPLLANRKWPKVLLKVNMFVLVHKQPARKVQPRPSLQESYRRHEMLMADLVSRGEGKRLPVAWQALWRLPPGMTWDDPVAQPWRAILPSRSR